MSQDMSCVFEGIDGIGAIFVSGVAAARNHRLLQRMQIGAVVSVAREAYTVYAREVVSRTLYVAADDSEEYDISIHFDRTFAFIDEARRSTNVLVHCVAGISRSATVVIAYLLKKYAYSLEATIALVKRRRDKIRPNAGFLAQLTIFAGSLPLHPRSHSRPKSSLSHSAILPSNHPPRPTSLTTHHRTQSLTDTTPSSHSSNHKHPSSPQSETLFFALNHMHASINAKINIIKHTPTKPKNIFFALNTEDTPVYSKGKLTRFRNYGVKALPKHNPQQASVV